MATAPEHFSALPEVMIRPMLEADVSAVVAIEQTSYRFPWSEGIFRDCLKVGYVCRVVEQFGTAAAYGIVSTGAGEAHILNLCVREDLRCRGIGARLLDDLPSNTAAIRLYQAFEFEQIGVRRGYYQAPGGREDAAVFKLDVRSRRARSG
jgi:ribosomal-protein-alanine N-acetyltransferase